jgi:hypothetical protein
MVANVMTAADLRRIADAMGPDEVVLADVWNREHVAQQVKLDMTEDEWRRFCALLAEQSGGLPDDVHEHLATFARQLELVTALKAKVAAQRNATSGTPTGEK